MFLANILFIISEVYHAYSFYPRRAIENQVVVVDLTSSSRSPLEIAHVLVTQTTFPHINDGDYVIVINADKALTGKWDDKCTIVTPVMSVDLRVQLQLKFVTDIPKLNSSCCKGYASSTFGCATRNLKIYPRCRASHSARAPSQACA